MYGSDWIKRVLGYQTILIKQLYALISGYGQLTSRMKWAWLYQFDSWSPNEVRAQLEGLAESGGFLEIK